MLVVATALFALSLLHTDPCPTKFKSDHVYEPSCRLSEPRDKIKGCLELGVRYNMIQNRCVGPITPYQCKYDIGGTYDPMLCEDALETTALINYTKLIKHCC